MSAAQRECRGGDGRGSAPLMDQLNQSRRGTGSRPRPDPILEALSGIIERVTFFNEENGYAVLRVQAKGHRELVTVVGAVPSANPGEWLTAEGVWVHDREFGKQFKAEKLTSTPPTTIQGIEKFLGSGMVKGIGPVYAKKMVTHFGDRIFDIIETSSAKLEDIDGIGPVRRKKIKQAWEEQKVIREIMVFLHSHGVSTSRAVRIFKTYGEQAIQTVRANPYGLARDIPGIGFVSADIIARQLGIPFDSLMRAVAGLEHVLLEATGEGHCALPPDLLKQSALALLDVPAPIVDRALEQSLTRGDVKRDVLEGDELIFLPRIQWAEEGVAARVGSLVKGCAMYPSIDFERAVAWHEQKSGKQLAASQRIALKQALTQRMLIVTGGPGVGKTTLVNAVLSILRAKKVRCLLCAPTGRAAKRLSETTGMEARTIHRLLEVQPGRSSFFRNEHNPLECDLLVVDETSMVDVVLMHSLLRALPASANLVLVGDMDQLPSVGPGSVLRDLIDSGVVPVAKLTEVFRQAAGSRIITVAHEVNQGVPPQPESQSPAAVSDFYFIDRETPELIGDTLVEVIKNRIPARFQFDPVRDVQVLCPMNRGSLGIRELNLRLQSELNPFDHGKRQVEKFGWLFREGDKVIQTENNYDKDVFNGDIGQIVAIELDDRILRARFDNREVDYEFGELDEIQLAYAITVHKSQGSEFKAVVMPIAMQQYLLLQRNLIYTGITRGRNLVVLIGQRKALGMAVRNDRTERRFSGLQSRLKHGVRA